MFVGINLNPKGGVELKIGLEWKNISITLKTVTYFPTLLIFQPSHINLIKVNKIFRKIKNKQNEQ